MPTTQPGSSPGNYQHHVHFSGKEYLILNRPEGSNEQLTQQQLQLSFNNNFNNSFNNNFNNNFNSA
ncbi:MAG TPA: hypothetical protein EYN66_12960 [Myxococcales bacterium]|nr:hypothetical protein [Myxococcales bacterium]